jgi:hypothetical protein
VKKGEGEATVDAHQATVEDVILKAKLTGKSKHFTLQESYCIFISCKVLLTCSRSKTVPMIRRRGGRGCTCWKMLMDRMQCTDGPLHSWKSRKTNGFGTGQSIVNKMIGL